MNKLDHLAIIMDGNGRWAKNRGLVRTKGHEVGAKAVTDIAKFCIENSIKNLTLYAFSTENWKRPKKEVDFLMKLLKDFLVSKRDLFIQNSIKFHTIGDIEPFSKDLKDEISNLKNLTSKFDKLNFILAINYGGRDEIIRAANKALGHSKDGKLSEKSLSQNLDTSEFGDVDLLIRTGGEQRLSNFLLWQASYAELCFTPTLWPDFKSSELKDIIQKYQKTHRKFGGL
ncbi:undecaprenyl diphosphate synthase [Campylobacter hyointestinalis]|uniref:polyprenyl diphosphate synthase n=1 Tax=Campylobacter hyointestinalis TaxID=198 RepID=UPI00072A51D9|nr:polyprenyl diphosphate synthase [Campylobacter hyointestinalis]PPB51637.1 di-trans,poly-cis-decaprenylcistransferase [Campylobacter hyointestinalis subsp. hyointestinalis]CUU69878.1 undecaprenyl diphosphate synthase [Campylobacter hyointestinalis subsp. hyointestinalis]CUU69881.1 undecaprenyl diphosphate synthase [Campylobacter hyointestinalis]CUU76577.1 undecaprenyl diphosphate synthase [Campylobacter hyointestinalis subsp. hyointestinalis]